MMLITHLNMNKRKRKDGCGNYFLDESPKRTKVHAQRKFAQGSNLSSPVITPIKEIERQERKPDVLPEPIELLPIKRPNTEDFLTFLCFRGTPILPPSLNFFNTATATGSAIKESESTEEKNNGPIATEPIKTSDGKSERPFIAFGVRKRADPVVISKQMDKKRRHALALQALRRKYQEQKLAKIRAATINSLSEKSHNKSLIRSTRSVSKSEIVATKKAVTEKVKYKVVETHVKPPQQPQKRVTLQSTKHHRKQKMCLRSFRGRFVHHELKFKSGRKKPLPPTKSGNKKTRDRKRDSDFSSDDDQPLVKTTKKSKPVNKPTYTRIVKRTKKTSEISFRITRSSFTSMNKIALRRQHMKQKLMMPRTSLRVLPKKTLKRKPAEKNLEIRREIPKKRIQPAQLKLHPDTAKNIVVKKRVKIEEPKQRPTRKTKEAAAIYMEILGHKLTNEGNNDDDNISIDSFPELPNVRKTEQRENELKAKAKVFSKKTIEKKRNMILKEQKPITTRSKVSENESTNLVTRTGKIIKRSITLSVKGEKHIPRKPQVARKSARLKSDSDDSDKEGVKNKPSRPKVPVDVSKPVLGNTKKSERLTQNELKLKKYDNLKENEISVIEKKDGQKEKIHTKNKEKVKLDIQQKETVNIQKNDKETQQVEVEKNEINFNDSDEEPLAKLTQTGSATSKKISDRKIDSNTVNIKKASCNKGNNKKATEKLIHEKPKRECTKKQNYTPLLSSSDEEEKLFHGFVQVSEDKSSPPRQDDKCTVPISADLLRRDVGRRFGKGKVNMSNEQIEKWLKDSAMAGTSIKKEDDEMLKFGEKIPTETLLQSDLPQVINTDHLKASLLSPTEKGEKDPKTDIADAILPDKDNSKARTPASDRKPIFRKEKKTTPNAIAFSANNESSVYAFGEENEDIISTPFRRPSRRPSSTATSRSEDEGSKSEDLSKNSAKFRLPPVVKPETIRVANKPEVSLMLSADDANSASIAVQVNLESSEAATDNQNIECSTQTDVEDSEQLFYIPLQPVKQNSSQVIQGVAVKLGTELTNGASQRVVMKAKLVTQMPPKLEEKPSTSMFPPTHTVQKVKTEKAKVSATKSAQESPEDFKYKVPSSPSASSSSSTKIYKRQVVKPKVRSFEITAPVRAVNFPSVESSAQIVEAPTFHPTDKEFQDPLEYIEKIRQRAEKFGICRIVPPSNFKPECRVSDDMRFTAYNQYVHKMLYRWGPNFKEMMAIKKYLQTQNITFTHPPWIGGMEIDLPRLYQTVQSMGGLKEVIEKKKWSKVSEAMKIPKSAQDRVTKLDDIYCKYLLPYDTLSPDERDKLFDEVETEWAKRESRTLQKVQQKTTIENDSNLDSDSDSDNEAEECIVKGRNMALNGFYRIARNTMSMWFKSSEPSAEEVEQEFWKHVSLRQNHICVHSGSIDCGNWGYGFAVSKNSPFARHAWNLKVLTNNSGSVLRSMGPVMGVTVPTLHVGMVFSACCWYRDPHHLPWIEYLHTGANKIWYGIPDSMSDLFHATLKKLVPNYCRNKSLWLPSDTAMIPPSILVESGVSLCTTVQEPGQYVVVFPKAFTSSISTGYVVSESVYFAPPYWLQTGQIAFDEMRNSCEPSMFSYERLILSIVGDARSNVEILKLIIPTVQELCHREKTNRRNLRDLGVKEFEKLPLPDAPGVRKKKRLKGDDNDYECEECRKNLFLSMVNETQEDLIYCLDHGIEHIKNGLLKSTNCKLLFTYDDEELGGLVDKLKTIIEGKQQKKVPSKFSGMPTMLK